jgi:raffinose/stachyose/melibiose transport system permease protein
MARGFRFFRSVFFLPVVIAPIAIGLMFSIIYNGDVGPLNQALRQVGLASFAKSWLGDKSTVLAAVTVPQVWQYVGFYMVIFLAAIRSVPREILESAAIDGANRVQTFTRIILPMLREVIVICMTLAVTGGLRAFDHSWVMTKGGPGIASSYIATLVYRRGMLDGSLGYGSSLTVTLLVLALIAAYGVRRIGKARP